MKTNKELLDFYGVKVGKTYKITEGKTHSPDASVFYEKDDTFSIRIYIGKAKVYFESAGFFSLSLLDDISYEEVEDILTDEERAYLSAVIKPFRKQILFIMKNPCVMETNRSRSYIYIQLPCDHMCFPYFDSDTMYKGMDQDKKYTLKDLGL